LFGLMVSTNGTRNGATDGHRGLLTGCATTVSEASANGMPDVSMLAWGAVIVGAVGEAASSLHDAAASAMTANAMRWL
jgi:hypothetical protein